MIAATLKMIPIESEYSFNQPPLVTHQLYFRFIAWLRATAV
jgi:hypothetical protein